ncbi:MAG: CocE/NonD family hydrolase [Haliscomenobacter sp.]|uniref:CocE/NonD family hydrolase n=1 Tax=Haliscomenobacter sp. TaxID=2717303 RepID=UPI0029A20929|nr:CocE/NonD family hydrolase [Haliscomenobacter sp.]MDX2068765.1 CocE/NonD family hydrolase [Haliscomenobacter sp.]
MKLSILSILFVLVCWQILVPCHAQSTKILQEKVQLSDGVKLSTDVYLPTQEGAYPVILLRTPYNKKQMQGYGQFFAANGYAVVAQDVRGEFASEGEFIPFINEKRDGLEVLDWIAKQSWCGGQIAGFGTSYIGFSALTLMDQQHPNLKTVFNISGWIKPATMNKPGGAHHLMLGLPWLLHEASQRSKKKPKVPLDSLFKVLPLKKAMQVAGIDYPLWENPRPMEVFNQDFDFSKVNIPVFHIGGWFDFVKEGVIENYLQIKKHGTGPQKLIVGPWYHNQEHSKSTAAGELDFGAGSYLGDSGIRDLALRWFNHWLKKQDTGLMDEPEVRLFNLFANEWKIFSLFPPQNGASTLFYLNSSGKANSLGGDGELSLQLPGKKSSDHFIFDPQQPVLTQGGANFHFFPDQLGLKDQTAIEKRQDVLVYTSEAFQKVQDIVGRITLRLFASTEGEDTDFTAKLVIVDQTGKALNLCDGIIRARHRNGLDKTEFLKPGKVYEFIIDLGHIAFQIKPGQRIRLEVSSSNFPKYDRNLNVALPSFEAENPRIVKQSIYHSKKYPSQLILPFSTSK